MSETFISDQFETWNKCPKMYYYKYIQKIRIPNNQNNFKLGKSVHSLMQYYLNGFEIKHLLQNANEDILNHFNNLKNTELLSQKVIATEWGFNSRIGKSNYWLNGRIDAIFFHKEKNKYIIADWKTGHNLPKNIQNSYQAKIYMYSFYKAKKDLKLEFSPEDIEFHFIKSSLPLEIEIIEFSKQKEQEIEMDFLKIISLIKEEQAFPKNENCNQKFCEYSKLCFSQ